MARLKFLAAIVPLETHEQQALVLWCKSMRHPYNRIFAIPNGSNKSPATAMKFRREGLRAGVPDLFLPWPSGRFHGLFIEMKRVKGGAVSAEQAAEIDVLLEAGYQVEICRGANEAKRVIENYLSANG